MPLRAKRQALGAAMKKKKVLYCAASPEKRGGLDNKDFKFLRAV